MWPGGSFTSLPEAFIYKPPFLAQWPRQSRSQGLIFHKLLCVFDLFSTSLKLKWVLELALQTSKINILMPQALALYEELNQLLLG